MSLSIKTERVRKERIRTRINCFFRSRNIRHEPCFCCGFEETEIHHVDYDQENLIVFLCRACHYAVENGKIKCPEPIDAGAAYGYQRLRRPGKRKDINDIKETFTVRIGEDEKEFLKKFASENGRTITEQIEMWIEEAWSAMKKEGKR